jgi:hypothetical protein
MIKHKDSPAFPLFEKLYTNNITVHGSISTVTGYSLANGVRFPEEAGFLFAITVIRGQKTLPASCV